MKNIRYEINGTFIEIEVTDEFAMKYEQIEADEKRINRKETRRHQSFDALIEGGFQLSDPESDIEEKLIKQCDIDLLHRALNILTNDQKWLVQQVFVHDRKQSEIAVELSVNPTSIRDRLRVIYKKIRKFLNQ